MVFFFLLFFFLCGRMSAGRRSEVPANSFARCWESIWCKTPQVSLCITKLQAQTHYLWCHLGVLTKQRWRSSQCKFFFLPFFFFDGLYFPVFTHSTVVKLYCFIRWWKSHQTDTEIKTNSYNLSAARLCVPLRRKECQILTRLVKQSYWTSQCFMSRLKNKETWNGPFKLS